MKRILGDAVASPRDPMADRHRSTSLTTHPPQAPPRYRLHCLAASRAVRFAAALGALTLLLLTGPLASSASAHATLLSTTPADDERVDRAPESVEIAFDEPVEAVDGGVSVFGPAGERVDRGAVEADDGGRIVRVAIDDAGIQGTYTVSWRALSEDSHNLTGSFVFHVGSETGAADLSDDPDVAVDLAGGLARWAAYVGALMVLGAVALAVAVRDEPAVRRRLRLLVLGGASTAVVATAVVLVAQTADLAGRGLLDALSLTPEIARDTRTGRFGVARMALFALAALIAAIPVLWRRVAWLVGVVTVGAMATWPLSGHAWTTSPTALTVITDLVHLAAVGVWVGGLFALGCSLPVATDRLALARRFSRVAVVTVIVVVITGTLSGFWQVRSLEALTSTGYGQLLVAKVAGVIGLVALGWANRRRLASWADGTTEALARFVRVEIVVAAVVLALTAALVNQPPARATVDRPFEGSASTVDGRGRLEVTVAPARVGPNDIHLYFFDDAGRSLVPVDAVEMTGGTDQISPRRFDVQAVTPSHFSVYGASLTSPGTWTFTVSAVREGRPSTYTIEVPVR